MPVRLEFHGWDRPAFPGRGLADRSSGSEQLVDMDHVVVVVPGIAGAASKSC